MKHTTNIVTATCNLALAVAALALVRTPLVFASTPADTNSALAIGWSGLDLRLPHAITWRSSEIRESQLGGRMFLARGFDSRGSVQLTVTEVEGAFAAKLWDGSGVQWESKGWIGQPVQFTKIVVKRESKCGGGIPLPPELQLQHAIRQSNEGGIAGNPPGPCVDAETVDILVLYTPCALELYAASQVPPILPPANPLPLLKADVASAINETNVIFDNSEISTADRTRHLRLVSLQPLTQFDACEPGTWVPDPPDPIFGCHQLPDNGEPGIWCGESYGFPVLLGQISDPEDPDVGGLVAQKRDYHRADLVVALTVSSPTGPGGIALGKQVNSGCDGATGFCVVDVLGIGAMTHEIGHNFGCCHEPGQGGSWTCSLFPYSFGHRFTVPDGSTFPPEVATVMTYPTFATQIPHFSNPDVLFPVVPIPGVTSQPTGTRQTQYPYWSDNARTIRETFDDVRCYRCADLPPSAPVDGPVTCFGSDSHGQSTPPDDLNDCVKVAAGYVHTVALESDGIVRAWGAGSTMTGSSPHFGQSLVPITSPEPPMGDGNLLGPCSAIAAGLYHSVAIRTRNASDPLDGSVVAWGAGRPDQFNSPHFGQSTVETDPTDPDFVGACSKVSAGHYHTVALRRDGQVRAWGAGESADGPWPHLGQCVIPTTPNPAGPIPIVCSDIAAGGYHTVVVTGNGGVAGGTVKAWGAGTTNTGTFSQYGQSIVPTLLGNCVAVAAGVFHTVALRVDGSVAAWGAGTTDTGVFPRYGQSIVPPALGSCTAIAAGGTYFGGSHTLVIKSDQTLAAWGAGDVNTGTTPHFGQAIVPVVPPSPWISIAAGGFHSAAIVQSVAAVPCSGDFNFDGQRDGSDVAAILSAWSTTAGDCNGDGTTNGADLTFLLSGWGACP